MNNLVKTELAEQSQQTVGTELANVVLHDVESDFGLTVHRQAAQRAQARIKTIQGDWRRMLNELRESYADENAVFARLYIQGSREDLLAAFMNVSRNVAATETGRATIQREVDRLIDRAVEELNALETKSPLSRAAVPKKK